MARPFTKYCDDNQLTVHERLSREDFQKLVQEVEQKSKK
jgi:hypothetical protein